MNNIHEKLQAEIDSFVEDLWKYIGEQIWQADNIAEATEKFVVTLENMRKELA